LYNPDVRIDIRDSNDVHYRVYALRFLLNHGDMLGVKGGDGIIGAIGRAERSARAQVRYQHHEALAPRELPA
jgi:hypothetical protein